MNMFNSRRDKQELANHEQDKLWKDHEEPEKRKNFFNFDLKLKKDIKQETPQEIEPQSNSENKIVAWQPPEVKAEAKEAKQEPTVKRESMTKNDIEMFNTIQK